MNKSKLIETYEKLIAQLEIGLHDAPNVKHMDSYKKAVTSIELLTLIIEDIKNLNGETVKSKEVPCLNNWACDNNYDGICKSGFHCKHQETE